MGTGGGKLARAVSLSAGAALVLSACTVSLPGAPSAGVKGASSNCADLFAVAMATPQTVNGTWDCLNGAVQEEFRAAGLDGDGGIAQLAAKEPVYDHHKYLGRLEDGGYIYTLSGTSGASVLLVWLDNSGKVAEVRNDARGSG